MSYWYPDWEFYKETHERMISEFGGYHGYIGYAEPAFNKVMKKVKEKSGLYEQAGVLFQQLRFVRLVEDGLRRTAHAVTSVFLESNGGWLYETDLEKVILFINENLLECTCEEVSRWLEHGET